MDSKFPHDKSKENVDLFFEEIIQNTLKPLVEIEDDGSSSPAKLNNMLARLGEKGIEDAIALVVDVCKERGINTIDIQTWIGPQGVGKGAIADTMKWVQKIIKGEGNQLYETFSTKYGVDENKITEIKEKSATIPDTLDETLKKVFEIVANSNSDTIYTGTGGIFYPQGKENPDKRYIPYIPQQAVTVPIVREGFLVDEKWTSFLVTLEIARSLLYGINSIELDVFPRTMSQADYIKKRLLTSLKDKDITLNHKIIHIEPIDKITTELIFENPKGALDVYMKLGNIYMELSETPEIHGYKEEDFNLLKALGIEDKNYDKEKTKLMVEGSEKMRETAVRIKSTIRDLTGEFSTENLRRIGVGLSASAGTTLFRVANRLSTQGRKDDASLSKLFRRLSAYYSDTAPVAIMNHANIIYAGASDPESQPATNYLDAVEGTLKSLSTMVNVDYNFENDTYNTLLDLTKEIYLIRTSK
jgi:adenylate kinase family enzyme